MSRWLLVVCGFVFAVTVCGWAPGADAQQTRSCAVDSVEVYDVGFTEISNQPEAADCQNFWRCYLAEQPSGPFLRQFDPACDPMAGACRVDLVVPLLFKGAHQTRASSFGTIAPWVLWFEGGDPPDDCVPWDNPDCGDTAACGTPGLGGQITFDRIDTFLSLSVTCGDLTSEDLRSYSLEAFSCPVASACPKTKKVSGLDFSAQALASFLGCPVPRSDDCNACDSCRRVGPGGASVGGKGPTAGGPGTGPEALLWYAAGGGAGEAGLPGSAEWNVALGRYWSHSYAQRIVRDPDETHVWLITDRATFHEFGNLDAMTGVYETLRPSDEYRTLVRTVVGWELTAPDGTLMAFDDDGLWRSTSERNAANVTSAVYTGTRLDEVHFPDGRREDFTYYPAGHASEGKLETITEVGVDGTSELEWTYAWSGDDLVEIGRPDGTAWVMQYSTDPDLAGHLTRIYLRPVAGSNLPDRVLVAWEYDEAGNVKETWRGAESYADPAAVDRWAFAYDDPSNPTETVVTDPLGDDITYTFDRDPASDKPRVTRIEGDCPTCSLGPNSQIVYDAAHPLRPEEITDGNGHVTRFTYNDACEVLSRTDAFGTGLARTTTWTYDATYPALVETVSQPSVDGAGSRVTAFVRDGSGNALQRTVSGVEGGAWIEPGGPVTGASAFSHTTVTTFNAAGRPLAVDPPDDGTYGTADRTLFTYDGNLGGLVPLDRTDPVVGTTGFTHDPFNRRIQVTDPNGVTTETAYDALDRVTMVNRWGAVPADDLMTVYEYDGYGDLLRIVQPEGNVVEYGYDAAGRLTEVARWNAAHTAGERVAYLLDQAGNRIREEHSAWDPTIPDWAPPAATTDYFYDTRCRLDRVVQPDGTLEGAVTEYAYDCDGNLEKVWDAAHPSNQQQNPPTATYAYDALDRLVGATRPWVGAGGGDPVTAYGYDVQDHLVRVTDAEGSDTFYTYSDRDLLVRESSPVAGVSLHAYNQHGELVSSTDGRGTTVTRTLDAADRVTLVDHPNPLEDDVVYAYDDATPGAFGLGRLASITRGSLVVDYTYDRFGRLTRDGELIYGYDRNGNRTTVGYPGGVTATYGYDFAERQKSLSVEHDAVVTPVVTATTYLPNGPLATLAFGNTTVETRGYDERYLPTSIALAAPRNRSWDYDTDKVGNVTEIVSMGDCAGDVTLTGLTVGEEESHTSCAALEAGPDVTVTATGDLDLRAATRVVLADGFSVEDGGRLVVGIDPALSGDVTKSYGYQDVDYFLQTADGPWGAQGWTYDRIGNRLSETSNGLTDLYAYAPNGAAPVPGNTALLESITLGVGGLRSFDYTDAGHQTVSSASGNAVTFTYDDSGRLVEADRSGSGPAVRFVYDGRSYLRQAGDLATTGSVGSTYDSAGLLHTLVRQENAAAPLQPYHLFHLAGRPVAQLATDTGQGDRWWYLTTDHLGTPVLATAADASELWESRFEPFGRDAAAGTALGALENEVFLRFPGQWEDAVWGEATLGAGVSYNLHRWYQPGVGRYAREDPGLESQGPLNIPNLYLLPGLDYTYGGNSPVLLVDPLGLTVQQFWCAVRYTLIGVTLVGFGGSVAGCAAGGAVGALAGGLVSIPGCIAGASSGAFYGSILGGVTGAIYGYVECGCELPRVLPRARAPVDADCQEIRQRCIRKCTDETLPTGTLDGAPFFKCLRECLDSFGC